MRRRWVRKILAVCPLLCTIFVHGFLWATKPLTSAQAASGVGRNGLGSRVAPMAMLAFVPRMDTLWPNALALMAVSHVEVTKVLLYQRPYDRETRPVTRSPRADEPNARPNRDVLWHDPRMRDSVVVTWCDFWETDASLVLWSMMPAFWLKRPGRDASIRDMY